MHLRGKTTKLRLVYPTGKTETVFKAKWDFNWQMGYDLEEPKSLPKGTRIVGVAHFDNSAANKFNPDPNTTVYWGDQNWDENAELLRRRSSLSRRSMRRACSRRQDQSAAARNSGPTLSALK